jgi:hypothetical protein
MNRSLAAYRIDRPVSLDGSLSDSAWRSATWSDRFVDMATGLPAPLSTKVAVLSTPDGLVVGFDIEDPFPSASVMDRDGIVFKDNDVEVFIDFGWGYYEFEINAAGTIYEVMHVWRDSFDGSPFSEETGWTIRNPDIYTFAGDFDRRPDSFWVGTHQRGVRIAHRGYDFPGLQAAVHVDGRLNEFTAPSRGWTAEVLFPWSELSRLSAGEISASAHGVSVPMFLGRFQQLAVGNSTVTAAWCVSPHGVLDTHQPERFTQVNLP